MTADDLLARAENETGVDIIDDLAAEVRRLRDERDDTRTVNETDEPRGLSPAVDYWRQRWAVVANAVTDLMTEVDTLRADQALDQEGHQRVCERIEAERDALRSQVQVREEAIADVLAEIDMSAASGYPCEFGQVQVDALRALVAPDPTSPTDTGDQA